MTTLALNKTALLAYIWSSYASENHDLCLQSILIITHQHLVPITLKRKEKGKEKDMGKALNYASNENTKCCRGSCPI